MPLTANWTKIATPSGPTTGLRVDCYEKHGKHGDYRLLAFDGDRMVHSATYPWNQWLGHCCGQLLMPGFIADAERLAADTHS